MPVQFFFLKIGHFCVSLKNPALTSNLSPLKNMLQIRFEPLNAKHIWIIFLLCFSSQVKIVRCSEQDGKGLILTSKTAPAARNRSK